MAVPCLPSDPAVDSEGKTPCIVRTASRHCRLATCPGRRMIQRRSPVRALIALALLTACITGPTAVPNPHYVLGQPYRAGGVWHYPHEEYELSGTGLAQAMAGKHPPLTSNGERFDPMAMAAAHPTLQLPAIARVTNLETGRAVLVRINDRGEGNPRRLIELTPRASALLGMADSDI